MRNLLTGLVQGLTIATVLCVPSFAESDSVAPVGGPPRPIAEKVVTSLPVEPLYWSIISYASLDDAKKEVGPFSLAAESDGKFWLFRLGPQTSANDGGVKVAEAGPIVPPVASRYMLRVSESISSPGRMTAVHTHPGSEAFYVLKGAIEFKTAERTYIVSSGESSSGPPPNTVMQATTVGSTNAHNLIMFVLDAEKPAQSPAHF